MRNYNLLFFNKLSWAKAGDILGVHESTIGYKKKNILREITPIIFVVELAYE